MNSREILLNKIREIADKTNLDIGDFGPLSGKVGVVLWYFYLSRYVDEAYYEIAEKSLTEILDNLQNAPVSFTHCGGYSGLCWALTHLKEHKFIDMDTDLLDDTDGYLFGNMEYALNNDNWDFLHGASGIILYFLTKKRQQIPDNKNVDKYIELFVEQINNMAIHEKDGSLKWGSNLYSFDMSMTRGYNICLSHGMSALIVIFTKIYLSCNKTNDLLRCMIEKTARYIINQRIDENLYGSCFPSYSIECDRPLAGSRMAWCYGDLGIAISLWQAGVALDEKEWCQVAIETMKHATTRKIDDSTMDAGICHGTAGIAHIFNKIFHYTKIEQFKTSSDYWVDETLKMAKFDNGIAGYKTYSPKNPENYINDYSLLNGVSGIGLCLLSKLYEDASAWDECLLLS